MGDTPSQGYYRNGGSAWQVALMAGALIFSLASGLFTLLNPRDDIKQVKVDLADEIKKNEHEIEQMRNLLRDSIADLLKATVSIREHEEFARREDSRIALAESSLNKLRDDLVTRPEHIQHWNEISDRINGIREGLNELRHDNVSNFTVGDALKRLQSEIDDLRRIDTRLTLTPPVTAWPSPSK